MVDDTDRLITKLEYIEHDLLETAQEAKEAGAVLVGRNLEIQAYHVAVMRYGLQVRDPPTLALYLSEHPAGVLDEGGADE